MFFILTTYKMAETLSNRFAGITDIGNKKTEAGVGAIGPGMIVRPHALSPRAVIEAHIALHPPDERDDVFSDALAFGVKRKTRED